MMALAVALAFAGSAAIAGLGLMGVVAPARLLALVGRFQTQAGIYAATAIRLVFGLALFLAAPASRAPELLQLLGLVAIAAGLITPWLGLERARRLLQWWTARGPTFVRVWAACAFLFGALLVWALA